jgi:MoaA/NifB/PqqE/SkfB family radical SAM enzyme
VTLDDARSGESDPGVVFAGYGEPLLRHDVLCDALREIRARRHGIATRDATNGLVDVAVCDALRDAGLRSVTVNFASADPDEYARIMAPRDGRTQGDALAFIERCSELGMEVEATTTRTPGVDIARARELTMALGASAFREREYFP